MLIQTHRFLQTIAHFTMSSQSLTSILKGFTADDLKIIDQLLNARQHQHQQQSYLSASSSDTDSNVSLVDDYSSDDEEHLAPVSKKRTTSGKPRGRPKKIRTEEEIANMRAMIEAKKQRRIEREIKDAMKSDEVVAKQHRIKMRKEAAQAKKAEKEQKALAIKMKRTEIYGKMLADAETYKAKWNL